ncbi:chromatin target of PRMT1b [Denticeps clupeoides]|uniref:chromatin target of PRMT1b n=1 Tax=Denticeps clupeoides TaxID=299321 RepID=UPI0010A4A8F8|nr:chromatin target of PRMT1 protein-like [Denticeps clupeoides]
MTSTKVTLKGTSTVSLNERFTCMLKSQLQPPADVKVSMQEQHVASARNRHLALQMENRPSVQAALGNSEADTPQQRRKRVNIHARLGYPVRGGARGFRGRGNRGAVFLRVWGRGGVSWLSVRRGLRHQGSLVARAGVLVSRGARGGLRGRGRGTGPRGRGDFARGDCGRGGWFGRPKITREELDYQLDAYMSKSKAYLDAELDAYMAQSDTEPME